jgi:hypothetical protein
VGWVSGRGGNVECHSNKGTHKEQEERLNRALNFEGFTPMTLICSTLH